MRGCSLNKMTAVGIGLLAMAALSSDRAAAITEYWQGSWDTTTVPIHVNQNGRKVTGRYRSGPGCTGRIVAEAEGPVGERLVGTFDDNCSGGNTGKLRATVDVGESPLTFRGKYCEYGLVLCGDWVRWKGQHR